MKFRPFVRYSASSVRTLLIAAVAAWLPLSGIPGLTPHVDEPIAALGNVDGTCVGACETPAVPGHDSHHAEKCVVCVHLGVLSNGVVLSIPFIVQALVESRDTIVCDAQCPVRAPARALISARAPPSA